MAKISWTFRLLVLPFYLLKNMNMQTPWIVVLNTKHQVQIGAVYAKLHVTKWRLYLIIVLVLPEMEF